MLYWKNFRGIIPGERRRAPRRSGESRSRPRTARPFTTTSWRDRYESGIQLAGTEVKSIRAGTLNLKDAYCTVKEAELWVHGMHISPMRKATSQQGPGPLPAAADAQREIRKLQALVKQDGYTLVPLSVYFKDARVKVEVGLCKGKKNYDKRDAAARRDAARRSTGP